MTRTCAEGHVPPFFAFYPFVVHCFTSLHKFAIADKKLANVSDFSNLTVILHLKLPACLSITIIAFCQKRLLYSEFTLITLLLKKKPNKLFTHNDKIC